MTNGYDRTVALAAGSILRCQYGLKDMLATRMREDVMARKAGRPKKPGGEGAQVRIDRDLAKMARAVANHSGSQIGDYLSGLLRPTITRDYRKMLQDLDSETEGSEA